MNNDTTLEKREQNQAVRAPEQKPDAIYTPLVDITETSEAFVFEADLPGVKAEAVEITVENGVLTIAAKAEPRQPRGQAYAMSEYGIGHFYRQFTLRTPIDADAIRAELKNGVLTLQVPKAESAKVRKIAIQAQ